MTIFALWQSLFPLSILASPPLLDSPSIFAFAQLPCPLIIFCFLTTLVYSEQFFFFFVSELPCPLPSFALPQPEAFVHFNKLDSCDTYVPPWGKFLCNALYVYTFLYCANWNTILHKCMPFPSSTWFERTKHIEDWWHLDREKAMSREYLLALLLFTLSASTTYFVSQMIYVDDICNKFVSYDTYGPLLWRNVGDMIWLYWIGRYDIIW